MRSKEKIRKFFNLIKKIFRILWIVIFFHWMLWATTYARAPQYYEAIKDKEITQHTETTLLYRGKGWLGKLVGEKKPNESTISEIEEDILGQIETETGKKNLSREASPNSQRLKELEKLKKEIEELDKKSGKSKAEEQELEQKRKDYRDKLKLLKEKTNENIKNQLNDNKLNITELNDRRKWRGQLFLDPLKFFLINPLNQICKALGILAHSGTFFFLAETIFKIAAIKLICLWICYPESVNVKIQENQEKVQNPQLSLEEREQSQQEVASLLKYYLFNMTTTFFFSWFVFLHPAHLDKTSGHFSKKFPFHYLLVLLIIIPLLLSFLSAESLRLGRRMKGKEIKDYLTKSWFIILIIFIFSAAWAAQNQGNYWWILFGFGVDFIFNLIRIGLFRTKTNSQSGTFKVARVKNFKE